VNEDAVEDPPTPMAITKLIAIMDAFQPRSIFISRSAQSSPASHRPVAEPLLAVGRWFSVC
jgi:hypothetical protein